MEYSHTHAHEPTLSRCAIRCVANNSTVMNVFIFLLEEVGVGYAHDGNVQGAYKCVGTRAVKVTMIHSPPLMPVHRLAPRLLGQPYVRVLKTYIEGLVRKWKTRGEEEGGGDKMAVRSFGSVLAAEVIDTFLGPNGTSGRKSEDSDMRAEPQWLRLKRAVVLVTRALDLFAAPEDMTAADRVRRGSFDLARFCFCFVTMGIT